MGMMVDLYQYRLLTYVCVVLLCAVVSIEGRGSMGGSGGLMSRNIQEEDVYDTFNTAVDNRADQYVDMTRGWSIPPLDREKLVESCGAKCGHYVADALGNAPLSLKLSKKMIRNPSGDANVQLYRAQAKLGSLVTKKNFRSVWTVGYGLSNQKISARVSNKDELLQGSYEECISRLYKDRLELEVMLPRTREMKKKKLPPPSVVYSFPMGQGQMSEKGSVSRGRGFVYVFPDGRRKKKASTEIPQSVQVDTTTLNLHSGPSVIDHAWAKGKKVFWKGRKVGQL